MLPRQEEHGDAFTAKFGVSSMLGGHAYVTDVEMRFNGCRHIQVQSAPAQEQTRNPET